MKGKGRDGRNSATVQGWSHRSRSVREGGWEGQEKRCVVVWGAPRQEGQEKRCVVVWGAPWQEGQRTCEWERKGREELHHGIVTVPQVPHRQGSGVGGTGEDVCRGVGCTTAGGTEV